MAFKQPPKKPDFKRLKSQLNITGLQKRDNRLYQVINGIIDLSQQSDDLLTGKVDIATTGAASAGAAASSIREWPIDSIMSTAVNTNPNTLLGYGTWVLFSTGIGVSGGDITFELQ